MSFAHFHFRANEESEFFRVRKGLKREHKVNCRRQERVPWGTWSVLESERLNARRGRANFLQKIMCDRVSLTETVQIVAILKN